MKLLIKAMKICRKTFRPKLRFTRDGHQVDEDGTRDVLAGAALGEEGVERVVSDTDSLVGGHLTIGLNAMLEAENVILKS
jgi:hypothetical protein